MTHLHIITANEATEGGRRERVVRRGREWRDRRQKGERGRKITRGGEGDRERGVRARGGGFGVRRLPSDQAKGEAPCAKTKNKKKQAYTL